MNHSGIKNFCTWLVNPPVDGPASTLFFKSNGWWSFFL
jgi:hypothetical protein